jgi:Domain of unknown function (DUF4337)
MPEEIEVPTEHLHEAIHEEAHKGGHGHEHAAHHATWTQGVALSSALMAVLAAVAALLAGHHANEGVLEQIRAANRWSQYQSKSIKSAVLGSKVEMLSELEKHAKEEDRKKLEEYKLDMKELQEKATELEHASETHMGTHSSLARTVTTLQVAIALSAIAVLTRKKWLWLGSLGLTAIGAGLFVLAMTGH